jgi:hypothetical protein
MSGTTAEGRGARERIKEMGIKGRLMKACQGQAEGSSVRRRSYILKEDMISIWENEPKRKKKKGGRTLCRGIDLEHMRRTQC